MVDFLLILDHYVVAYDTPSDTPISDNRALIQYNGGAGVRSMYIGT